MPDREGVKPVLQEGHRRFPTLRHVWADQGYTGKLIEWAKSKVKLTLEIVKHPWSDMARGVWLPKGAPPPVIPKGFYSAAPLGCGADIRLAREISAVEQRL